MAEFVKVARVSEVPDPGKQVLEIDDRFVVLFHVGGEFFCLDDRCTHDDGPLGEGDLCDHTIACPRHGAKFDIRDGRALTMPATEPTAVHDVRVDGDDVFVRIQEA
jgi:3-phenylpropionate/trans-cinnamate dioxygenase ferredoxin subunit